VALNLAYTTRVEPSVPSKHNDEVVIQVSTNINGGTQPELTYNTSKVRNYCVVYRLVTF